MKLWKDKHGSIHIQSIALLLVLMLIALVGVESMRLMLITKGVRDALETAAAAAATDNWNELYSGLREGHTGGYTAEGAPLYEQKELFSYLERRLGVKKQSGVYRKANGSGKVEYELSAFSSRPVLTPRAPSDRFAAYFSVATQATLTIPMDFGNIFGLPPFRVTLRVLARYTPKFSANP